MWIAKKYLYDDRGAVAVEFAIVSLVAILVIVFTLSAGLVLYLNQALDYATAQASRQIITGSAQATSLNSSNFRTSLCGYLPKAMICDNVVINLYVVPKAAGPAGYYAFANADMSGLAIPDLSSGSGRYTLGIRGDFQYLQVIYPITLPPAAIMSWLSGRATYKGVPAYLAVSTAAFRNEQF
ncbi:TadE/TadG family type IV pilus assembly protein [Methylobacterium sp. J-090]|uniref:TadE/TadG family type IV pilus assembly protein n=1 Tax=Methylobacterium sp. J-090 TaxID=2836666 RepID=UPI001FBB19E1|nr:TadE/TadG family type IV pilus assembly protein [Methylobacterium sp. J-090]MCJ2084071.1 pilus assembly protein [Methylobacterium sp. J-090]